MFYCKSSPVPRAKQSDSGGVRTVHQIVKYLIRYFPDPVQSRYLPSASGDKTYNYSSMCPVVENVFTAYSQAQPKVVRVLADISN